MTGLSELHLAPGVAALLQSWGYDGSEAGLREQAPAAARGSSLVLAWPPSARYAVPALAGLVSAISADHGRTLVLVPAHALDEWAATILPLSRAAGIAAQVAHQAGRVTRRLREERLDLLLTSPDVAASLITRSTLKADTLARLVLAWPEEFDNEETLVGLMQDLPRENQRIIHPARPCDPQALVERYARRALVSHPVATAAVRPPVRVVTTLWHRRQAALAGVLETLDPATAVVWAQDGAGAAEAAVAVATTDLSVQVVTGDAPAAALVIAWDLPTADRLAQLGSAGEVVLLVPPHATGYVAGVAGQATALRLPGALDQARNAVARRRVSIEQIVEQGGLESELVALAPLFERHDPALVAAALYRQAGQTVPVPAPVSVPTGTAQMWVGAGRKDEVSPNDIVAALTKEIGVDRTKIGKIEIRELYSLVELPAAEAEEICGRLSGRLIRRRRVVARMDRKGR
jgi:DbpA-like RNA binding protein